MIFGKYRRKLEDYSLALKISVLSNVVLIIVIFILISFVLKVYANRQMVVTIPPQIPGNNTLVLGVNTASKETIRIFSTYFGQLLGNYTPQSVEAKLKVIHQYLSPLIEVKEKLRLFKNISHVQENQIEQRFVIEKVKIQNKGSYFDVQVRGKINRKVGNFKDELNNIPYMYKISIMIRNGSPYIIKPIVSEFIVDNRIDKKTVQDYKKENIYIEYKK